MKQKIEASIAIKKIMNAYCKEPVIYWIAIKTGACRLFLWPLNKINKEYRKIDRPTDVISFALQDDLSDVLIEESMCELGDIFINVQAIRDQAKEYGHSLRREACFLFCHGLLHLMGYDHMEPEEEKVMFELQDVILDEVVSR